MRSIPHLLIKFPLAPWVAMATLCLLPGGTGLVPAAWAQVDDGRMEILTRGPIHEAFAATITFKSTPGVLVPKAPPLAIEEIPPDQRPEGSNISWIPGYWAWDEEAADFLWVSGIWRNIPPGRQWMPGYWSESGQDYQWISGYWADAAVAEVEYLDEPPASLEAGPNVEAPSRNHQWIPGTWRWSESRYAWQGGYWDEPQPDWIWVPAYYCMTPRGYIYVDGYYDYEFGRRGVVFAPVRFRSDGFYGRDYRYRPSMVISLTALVDHLFLRPRSRHYYFGDYYAPRYRESGYYASYNYYSGGYGYDPIYAHQRWTHRNEDGWQRRYEENYTYYRDHEEARPPHTLAAFATYLSRPGADRRVKSDFATRLDGYAGTRDSRIKFRSVNEDEQKSYAQRGQAIREFGEERRKLGGRTGEVSGRDPKDPSGKKSGKPDGEPKRIKLPKSPIAAEPGKSWDKGETPPARPKGGRGDGKSGGGNQTTPPRDSKDGPDKSDGRSGGKSKNDGEGRPGADPKGKPEAPRRAGPADDAKPMPDVKPNERAKEMPQAKPGEKVKEMPDRKPEPRQETQDPRQTEPKGQPRTRPEAESPKREPKSEPKREPRAEPKREPKAEPRPEPKREPKAEPKRESRPEPRAEPKREPKSEPKRTPPEPRREAPKAEPKRQPKAQPEPKAPSAPQTPPAAPSGKKGGDPDEKKEKDKKGRN